ncbi:MAG TPA: tetratricopeptide repeat protein [Pyrinomonadaceae bacterium]|nr:tetratricopeptide repeat protein [Pyrinomonadaceae bacterium]
MNLFLNFQIFRSRRKYFTTILCAVLFFSAIVQISAQEEVEDDKDDPVKIFNQGQDEHEKGNFAEAIKFYDKALEILPEFPEAEYQKGNALLSLNKPIEAEKSFRKAVELREDWTLALASHGAVLVRLNQFTEAEPILEKAIELDDLNFPAYAALTELRIKTKAKPEALKDLLEKVKILTGKAKPTASIWASRAALENALGDKVSAKTSLKRALEIEPKNQFALSELADIALNEGDSEGADGIIKTLLQLAPDTEDVKILQARTLLLKGKTDEALKILDSVTKPTENLLTIRAKIIANNSVNVSELEKQLEKDSKNASILARLCILYRKDDPAKALEYCRRASEAEPSNINHAIGFGAALVQAQKFNEAVNLFTRLKGFAPDNYTIRANLATALFQLKRFAEAKTEYQWLTEKQPDLAITYYLLGIVHDQLNEYLDAMANYQQFLRLADANQNQTEIEKVNLRLPALQKLIKEKKGKD